ncbi:allatostatin-A receptor-like [Diadema setosum]|uniref:allatostatin-A receptor-like n=1 Tax=Diadema setosum TaxID=31175 RepID=UPI003B3AFD22
MNNNNVTTLDDVSLNPTRGDGLSTGAFETVDMVTLVPEAVWTWQPVEWTWWMILQLVLSILGIVGNFLVIIVLFRRRALNQSTDTLIGALAVADFLTSVFMIPIPTATWVPTTWLGELYCRLLFTSFFLWICVSGSIFTLTAISVERFIAVQFPFAFNRLLRRRHVVISIFVIWGCALAADIFIVLTISVESSSNSCAYHFPSQVSQEIAGVTSYLLHFVIPAAVMLVTQIFAARALYRQSLRFRGEGEVNARSTSSYKLLQAKNRVLKLLVVVILIFIICWGPNSLAYFLYNIGAIDYTYLYGSLNKILTLLAFCNSCANPFIYTIQYPQFRTAIRELLTCSHGPMAALFESSVADSTHSRYKEKSHTQLTDIASRT